MSRKRVAILVSGRGSNMAALIEAAKAPDYPAEIALVISNVPGAVGLARAREANVLSVGEAEGFISRGGVINFYSEQDTVRFEISQKAAERAGIKLSARLLSVARVTN